MKIKQLLFSVLFLFVAFAGYSQQLTYKPINPAFGGDTFNYQWLMSSAEAQNSFKDPNAQNQNASDLQSLNDDLNRQLLNQISRTLFNSQLGDSLQPGTFNFGSLALEIYDSGGGLVINILDTQTGEQTQIVVPN